MSNFLYQAPSDYLVEYATPEDSGGRVAPQLGLKFNVARWHFHNGKLKLRCSAHLRKFYVAETVHNGIVSEALGDDQVLDEIQYISSQYSFIFNVVSNFYFFESIM